MPSLSDPPRRRLTRRESGGSVIEVALLAPVLMLIFFGMIDLGRWVFLGIEVSSAARAGAQFGAQSLANAYNTAGVQAAAQADVPDIPGLSVTPSTTNCWCGSAPGTVVTCGVYPSNPCTNSSQIVLLQVTTSATYTPWVPYPFRSTYTITGQAVIPTGQY